jgi:recombination protein RecA
VNTASRTGGDRRPDIAPCSTSCRERRAAPYKCAPPFTEAEFEIRWGKGIDCVSELLDLGVARALVDKAGNHLSFAGSPLGNGRERSRETLSASNELQSTLRQAIVASGPVRPGRRVEAEA